MEKALLTFLRTIENLGLTTVRLISIGTAGGYTRFVKIKHNIYDPRLYMARVHEQQKNQEFAYKRT